MVETTMHEILTSFKKNESMCKSYSPLPHIWAENDCLRRLGWNGRDICPTLLNSVIIQDTWYFEYVPLTKQYTTMVDQFMKSKLKKVKSVKSKMGAMLTFFCCLCQYSWKIHLRGLYCHKEAVGALHKERGCEATSHQDLSYLAVILIHW